MRGLITASLFLLLTVTAVAQQKKIIRGFDGGMMETPSSDWAPIDRTRYHSQGFMAIDPFVGCDFIVSGPMHLTLKVDYLCALSQSSILPHGPRVYVGFLFYH